MSDASPLIGELAAAGHLTDERWSAILDAVPRQLFIPDRAVASPPSAGGGYAPYLVDRGSDPDAWWRAVYSNTPIVVQLDDGETDLAAVDGNFSSSASAPSVVMDFLELLDPYDGDEVLEIGTGTGWTAALLSARLGEHNVTTIEVDHQVAKHAGGSLRRAGCAPRLIIGDGAQGHPEGAPFDRVHVTCGVREIPYAWVEQTRPGGVIVVPWMPGFSSGHKVRLTVVQRDRGWSFPRWL